MIKRIVKKREGFSLVEVLLSLVILSIIVVTFLDFFVFTNKTAVKNNDQLIAIHLAKSTMERIKLDPFSFIDAPVNNQNLTSSVYTIDNCPNPDPKQCELLFAPTINDRAYEIQVTVSQNNQEKKVGLLNVLVNVNAIDSETPISSSVEGYVSYE